MRTLRALLFALLVLALPAAPLAQDKGIAVKGVRYFSYPTFTRVVFEIEAAASYVLTKTDDGKNLIFSAYEGRFTVSAALPAINDGVVGAMELRQDATKPFIQIRLGEHAGPVKDFVLRSPDRIVLDISRTTAPPAAPKLAPEPAPTPAPVTPPVPAPPEAPAPAPKKQVIMIDPGHGGRDSGIVTAHGYEKARSLDLAAALRRELQRKLTQYTVMLTREKDQTLSLTGRASSANGAGSVLFISLHFAAGRDARVYILGLEQGGTTAGALPKRDFLGFEAETEKRERLWGSQQTAHLAESSRLGRKIAQQITGRADAGPVQAPLALLRSVDAPAVVVEAGIELNRKSLAEAIAQGVENYVREIR